MEWWLCIHGVACVEGDVLLAAIHALIVNVIWVSVVVAVFLVVVMILGSRRRGLGLLLLLGEHSDFGLEPRVFIACKSQHLLDIHILVFQISIFIQRTPFLLLHILRGLIIPVVRWSISLVADKMVILRVVDARAIFRTCFSLISNVEEVTAQIRHVQVAFPFVLVLAADRGLGVVL